MTLTLTLEGLGLCLGLMRQTYATKCITTLGGDPFLYLQAGQPKPALRPCLFSPLYKPKHWGSDIYRDFWAVC